MPVEQYIDVPSSGILASRFIKCSLYILHRDDLSGKRFLFKPIQYLFLLGFCHRPMIPAFILVPRVFFKPFFFIPITHPINSTSVYSHYPCYLRHFISLIPHHYYAQSSTYVLISRFLLRFFYRLVFFFCYLKLNCTPENGHALWQG